MTEEGPPLELLLRRLAETPPDFLDEPAVGKRGSVHTLAVVSDLLRMHGATAIVPQLAQLADGRATAESLNRLRLAAVLAWLLADPWFVANPRDPGQVLEAIASASLELAGLVPAASTVGEPERREELSRLALARLALRPAGEGEAFARDRLTTLSSSERARVLAASRAAEQRARAIREQLAKKAAEEAADKWNRE
ncbi:MAG TPA: hypothetical protein VNO33_20280 [Kofleriaceae bacterium]|nr:hypothetical protein [Kofleriaceae bacterium]